MQDGSRGELYSTDWKRKFRQRLLRWFERHARDLPWRRTRDPYHIWVSEIMLQQTQVATVVDYFNRFVTTFPSVEALAAADEHQVLRLWEGLGYYRRARQMHRAAQVIVSRHHAELPRDVSALNELPGIGRYTAGAIASIAWDTRVPILEANTIRLFCRLLAYAEDPTKSAGQRQLWQFSESLLPRKKIGLFNQALMELGSEVCTPRSPGCDRCPVHDLCPTNQGGLQEFIPQTAKKMKYEDVVEAAVVIFQDGRVLLRRCKPSERWAGLWDFPRFAVDSSGGEVLLRELEANVARMTGLTIQPREQLTTIKHGVTRFRITLLCHTADVNGGQLIDDEMQWVAPQRLQRFPLSVTGRKISQLLL